MTTVRIHAALMLLAVLAAAFAGCNDDGGRPGDGGTDPTPHPTIKIKTGAWDIAANAAAGGLKLLPLLPDPVRSLLH